MKTPTNTAAETIQKLEAQNADMDLQITVLNTTKQANVQMIVELEAIATWDVTPEPKA